MPDPSNNGWNEWSRHVLKELERLNFSVEKVNYREISKFGGLFRCSTLPLERKS